MDVVRDVLDKSVADRNGREMGRVDGIVLVLRDGQPPRLGGILIGPAALGYRLHPAIGRFVSALEARLGLNGGRPVRVGFDDVDAVERKVKLRLTIGDTAAEAVEQLLRVWIMKIPGNR
jgi:sporulation protein YlmC with PRC-barrel domain